MALEPFFSPKTVAVIGVSRNPQKVGHVVYRNFLEGGFTGKVFAVNPNAESLFGRPAYKAVGDIPEKVDLAVICVPAELVPKAVEECGRKRVPAAIVLAGGFKEVGNAKLEGALAAAAERGRVRVIGPNCLGVLDPATGVDTVFLPRYKL
ncbi:MAG TPA: CoA-binding protein [archaeon]|nr:CoA-binding protein [archaeon]